MSTAAPPGTGRLKTDLGALPTQPGVYLMKDDRGDVIYVGKAASLRQRVRQYFTPRNDGRAQVPWLVRRVHDIEVVVTATEREALLLENNLIKKYQPRYNVRLKDDKTWLSIRVSLQEPFPRVTLVRRWGSDGARYFGPYLNDINAREVVSLIQQTYPLRTCTDAFFRAHSDRPCLEYQIGNCAGPCAGRIDAAGYHTLAQKVCQLLEGRDRELADELRVEMEVAAEALRFEDAARVRDRIRAIDKVAERQRVQTGQHEDEDLWGFHREGDSAALVLLPVRDGRMQDARAFVSSGVASEDGELLQQVLMQVYRDGPPPPPRLLLPLHLPDTELVAELLAERSARRVSLRVPQRGDGLKRVAMASANARVRLAAVDDKDARRQRGLDELQHALQLPDPPVRIECYDMSNIQGTDPVGAMVTFRDGQPDKSGYRVFKVRTVEGPDDYASMREVLGRRFARADRGWPLPDLVVIDGGRGQLRMATEAAIELGHPAVRLCSLAKPDEGEGEKNPESVDKVYLPGRKNPVILSRHSAGLHILQHIRDEAHRFSVHHHRQQRRKRTLVSRVDTLPGVGAARGRALLTHFGSWKRLTQATEGDLAGVPGIGRELARRIATSLASPPAAPHGEGDPS